MRRSASPECWMTSLCGITSVTFSWQCCRHAHSFTQSLSAEKENACSHASSLTFSSISSHTSAGMARSGTMSALICCSGADSLAPKDSNLDMTSLYCVPLRIWSLPKSLPSNLNMLLDLWHSTTTRRQPNVVHCTQFAHGNGEFPSTLRGYASSSSVIDIAGDMGMQ